MARVAQPGGRERADFQEKLPFTGWDPHLPLKPWASILLLAHRSSCGLGAQVPLGESQARRNPLTEPISILAVKNPQVLPLEPLFQKRCILRRENVMLSCTVWSLQHGGVAWWWRGGV